MALLFNRMGDAFYNPVTPAHVPAQLVRDFNIYDFDGEDPFEVISRMHRTQVPEMFWTRNNGGHWVAFGADAIAAVSKDTRRFSSARPIVPDGQNFESPVFIPLVLDPPDHGIYREVLAPLFHIRHIEALEHSIREFTDTLAIAIRERGACDFMADFAQEMPIVVFLRLLDLPLSEKGRLLRLAANVVKPDDGGHRDDPIGQIIDYLTPIIHERFNNPGRDVISRIVTQPIKGRPMLPDEMIKLTTNVLLAGLETVSSSLGFIAHYLAENPGARQQLIEHPEVIPSAVDEFLRRFPPATTGRILTGDATFRGIELRKNEHVVWTMAMFNLDQSKFEDPMRVDFQRKRSQHSSFGIGVHFCLGAFLARMELSAFLERWLKYIPEFHVAPGAKLTYRTGLAMSLTELPIVVERDGTARNP
jgi:camphor 5-monooxygenase